MSNSVLSTSLSVLLVAALPIGAVSGQAPCGVNLLHDSGCEAGVGAAWVPQAGTWTCQQGPNALGTTPAARGGLGYFFAGSSATDAVLYQDVDVTAFPIGQRFRLTSWAASASQLPQPGSDTSQIALECRSASGVVLASSASFAVGSVLAWSPLFANLQSVPGTTTIRVKLLSHRNLGINNDGYHDDVVLVALPVAGTGATNGPFATLLVNGLGSVSTGPFHAPIPTSTATLPSNLAISVTGSPNQPLLLMIGASLPCAIDFGCAGCLDLFAPQTLLGVLSTDAAGSLSLTLPLPAIPAGLGFGLQAAVGAPPPCGFALSASFCVTLV
jgi:hypothetical protein